MVMEVEKVSSKILFETSDIITLHIPKSAGVVIAEKNFKLLSPQVTIVNSSGHENIDVFALKSFLTRNHEASYLFLAKPTETYFSELSNVPNCYLFPLFSSRTEEAERLRKSVTIENLQAFLQNKDPDCRVI
jgi:lactate dehydrogenase-like 2-hydroxyacid dehydrogenase